MSTEIRPAGSGAPDVRPHVPGRAEVKDRLATRWTIAATVLALASAVGGLAREGVYTGPASTAAMLRGFDLVTAVVVVPALAVAIRKTYRGATVAHLVVLSLVSYLAYTYAYYAFGTDFNDLFLLNVAVLATAGVALVLHLGSVDLAAASERVRGVNARAAAVVLGVLAAALAGMWVYFALHNAVTGTVPAGSQLVESDTIVHLGIALDLAVLVPLYSAAAHQLWKRSAWGYVLGLMSVIAGVLHQLTYMVAMPFQVAADVPGAVAYDPAEPIIVLLYVLGAFLLLRQQRARQGGRTVPSASSHH